MTNKLKVGFIGLGLMGKPMALNILKAGFSLAVYNRSKSKTEKFRKLGCTVFGSPKELARNVDVVISMVTGPDDVRQVHLGKKGTITGAREGLVAIDMSTIGPKASIEIANELRNKNIEFLDAPVTGSVWKATSGELTIFIGGKKEVYEKVKRILMAMGNDLQYIGEGGKGQAIKLINNMIAAISLTGLAEGMLLADSLGLSREKTAKGLENSPVISSYLRMKFGNFVKDDYSVAFSVKNMIKDLRLAISNLPKKRTLPLLKLTEELMTKTDKKGLGEKDLSAIIKVLPSFILNT